MKQKLFLLDLAACSLWALAVLGSRHSLGGIPANPVVVLAVVSRITLAFTLCRKEKRSWVPLLLFMGLTFLVIAGDTDSGIHNLTRYPFAILGLAYDYPTGMVIRIAWLIWLGMVPVITYLALLFCKKLKRTTLTWKDTFGAVLWNDDRARTYSLLLLVAAYTLYAGLTMNTRMSLFMCLLAPTLSYWLLSKHYGMEAKKFWPILIGMVTFFYAQSTAGVWRMGLLGISIAFVAYSCSRFYKAKRKLALSLVATLYLGALLPSLAIGYNPYACINYGRFRYYTLTPYTGIFYIKDHTGDSIGLRDRYGLLVKPEYERLAYHDRHHWFGELELRKNGYYTLYDICDNTFRKGDKINAELQDSICRIVDRHFTTYDYIYDDRMEIKVTECASGHVLSHVKVLKNGSSFYFDYGTEPYIKADSVAVTSGEFVSDSLVAIHDNWTKKTLSYSYDVNMDSVAKYNIFILSARDKMPLQEEEQTLATCIADLLNRML